ncbi:MAG TPA: hypothetical protein VEO19_14655 [Terriglobia bacterium]|nr:hypothetical protein [Terriglobia bacterium]
MPNPRQGVVNGPRKPAVGLFQSDLYCCAGFTRSHVDRIPTGFVSKVNRIDQIFATEELALFREEQILISKKFTLIHGRGPEAHVYWKYPIPIVELYNHSADVHLPAGDGWNARTSPQFIYD